MIYKLQLQKMKGIRHLLKLLCMLMMLEALAASDIGTIAGEAGWVAYTSGDITARACNKFKIASMIRVQHIRLSLEGRTIKKPQAWVFPAPIQLNNEDELFLLVAVSAHPLSAAKSRAWVCFLHRYKYNSSKNAWIFLAESIKSNKWLKIKGRSYFLNDEKNMKIQDVTLEYYFLDFLEYSGGGKYLSISDFLKKNQPVPLVKKER